MKTLDELKKLKEEKQELIGKRIKRLSKQFTIIGLVIKPEGVVFNNQGDLEDEFDNKHPHNVYAFFSAGVGLAGIMPVEEVEKYLAE